MHPSGKLPEPVNPPILNLGCRLDTIFANFKHIISLLLILWAPVHYSMIVFKTLCTHVPEGYFRAMLFRLLQEVQQIVSRVETMTDTSLSFTVHVTKVSTILER